MAAYFGLGTMSYSPLAGGLLTAKYRHGNQGRLTQSAPDGLQEDPVTAAIIDHLELIAKEGDVTPGQVALAWVLTKNCFPIPGARFIGHMEESLKALSVSLRPDQLMKPDVLSAIPMGYLHDLLKTVQRAY